jgi:hypothetical protein
VNFTVLTSGGQHGTDYAAPSEEGQKCLSGCANVLITVEDSLTHKPISGASVAASVNPIAKLDLGDLANTDNEFLCVQADRAPGVPQSPCGTDLDDLPTDKQGHVYLIYWAPGLVDTAQTTLNASASFRDCSSGPCTDKAGTAAPTTLVVRPYPIYQQSGLLPAADVNLLVELAQEPNHFVADLALDQSAERLIEVALKALDVFEAQAASIAGVAGLTVSTAVHAVAALSNYGTELGLVSMLLSAEKLRTLGLGAEPYATTLPREAATNFTYQILRGLGDVPVPGLPAGTGLAGILWTDAQAVNAAEKHAGVSSATNPESISLTIYEISHCDEGYPVCGPGYEHLASESGVKLGDRHGIQAQLCLYFTGSGAVPGLNWSDHFCESQYAAPFWVAVQPGLNRTLP